jgi:hypothetical protein
MFRPKSGLLCFSDIWLFLFLFVDHEKKKIVGAPHTSLKAFDDGGDALADADTHGRQAVVSVTPF